MIREGDNGRYLYVSSQGEYEVIKDGKVLGKLGTGKAFGELAILYNCKRTASIKGKDNLQWIFLCQVVAKKKKCLAQSLVCRKGDFSIPELPDSILILNKSTLRCRTIPKKS